MSKQQGPLELTELVGTVCVVTGAGNNGIGYGIAEIAASKGMHVVLMDLHKSVVGVAELKLSALYPDVRVISCAADVTSAEDMKGAAAWIAAQFPAHRIGAIFANAGVLFPSSGILRSNPKELHTMLNVNVVGVLHTVQAFAPYLKANTTKPSIICTTASIGGLIRCDVGLSGYCATKHAVVALTESLSFELARSHSQIRVHCLCPCIVATGIVMTSATNQASTAGEEVQPHDLDSDAQAAINSNMGGMYELGMTPSRHGEQVWDRIAAGEFYMITDNIRPYVDHDYPYDGVGMVASRFEAIQAPDFSRRIDNGGAMRPERAAFIGPLSREAAKIGAGKPKPGRAGKQLAKAKL